MKKNEIILDFGIWGFNDISHNEITIMLGIEPVKLHIIGEKINPKFLSIAKKKWVDYDVSI